MDAVNVAKKASSANTVGLRLIEVGTNVESAWLTVGANDRVADKEAKKACMADRLGVNVMLTAVVIPVKPC